MRYKNDVISMGNQMVTSEIRKQFHARFVKILILEFWKNASETTSQFHEYTIWFPFNIMGDKLRSQSWVTEALP